MLRIPSYELPLLVQSILMPITCSEPCHVQQNASWLLRGDMTTINAITDTNAGGVLNLSVLLGGMPSSCTMCRNTAAAWVCSVGEGMAGARPLDNSSNSVHASIFWLICGGASSPGSMRHIAGKVS